MRFIYVIGVLSLLLACRQSEPDACGGGGVELPACDFNGLDKGTFEAIHQLSNKTGIVVQYTRSGAQGSIVRINLKGTDTYLDPCNLPENVDINSEIRFCATWYQLKDFDHLNFDYFPIEFCL